MTTGSANNIICTPLHARQNTFNFIERQNNGPSPNAIPMGRLPRSRKPEPEVVALRYRNESYPGSIGLLTDVISPCDPWRASLVGPSRPPTFHRPRNFHHPVTLAKNVVSTHVLGRVTGVLLLKCVHLVTSEQIGFSVSFSAGSVPLVIFQISKGSAYDLDTCRHPVIKCQRLVARSRTSSAIVATPKL